jgi:hypothetical protein
MKTYLILLLAATMSGLQSASPAAAQTAPARATAKLLDVRTLSNEAPHSAFTDLIDWNGTLVCAFREGRGHVSADGKIAVLTSPDGEEWERAATLSLEDVDLRDASLSVAPDGRLMLLGGVSPRSADGVSAPTGSFVAFSGDGRSWTKPQIVSEPGRWLWRVTWREGKAYGVSYAAPTDRPIASLLVSEDGVKYSELVPKLFTEGYPTEAVIRFDREGTAYCLLRRDGAPAVNSAYLGIASPPYDAWEWSDLKRFFGGPNFLQLPDGRWIAAGRLVRDGKPSTDLALLDAQAKALVPILTLPSGGDTSYPGLVYRDGVLWVSYYSSHEGKTSIYLAQVELSDKS